MSHTTWLWLADLALSAIDGAAATVLSSALIKMTPSPVWKLDYEYAGNAAARRGAVCGDGDWVFIRTKCLSGVTAASSRRADDEARRASGMGRCRNGKKGLSWSWARAGRG
ncbi:hypothetical protein V8C42DRAFT_306997 [Trichoderma barbatum]